MNTKWKNRILYWALAIIPLGGVWVLSQFEDAFWFVGFLFFYLFIYRPLLDTQRLISLGKIEEKDAWRFFVPLAVDRIGYTKALWLG